MHIRAKMSKEQRGRKPHYVTNLPTLEREELCQTS